MKKLILILIILIPFICKSQINIETKETIFNDNVKFEKEINICDSTTETAFGQVWTNFIKFYSPLIANSKIRCYTSPADNKNYFEITSDSTIQILGYKLLFESATIIELNAVLKLAPTSEPTIPIEGMIYYDVTAHKLKMYNGTEWKTIAFE